MTSYPANAYSSYNSQGQQNSTMGGAPMNNTQRTDIRTSAQFQQHGQPGNAGQRMSGTQPQIIDIRVALPGRDSAQVPLPHRVKQPPRDPNTKTDLNFITEEPTVKQGERVLYEPEPVKPETMHLKEGESMPQPTVTRRLVAVSEMVKGGKRLPAERKSPPGELTSERSPEKKYSGAPVAEIVRQDSGFKIGEKLKLGAGTKGVQLSPDLSSKKTNKKPLAPMGQPTNTNSGDLYRSIDLHPVGSISHNIYEHQGSQYITEGWHGNHSAQPETPGRNAALQEQQRLVHQLSIELARLGLHIEPRGVVERIRMACRTLPPNMSAIQKVDFLDQSTTQSEASRLQEELQQLRRTYHNLQASKPMY